MIRIVFDQQQGADGLIFDVQVDTQIEVALRFPLAVLKRTFPITATRAFPLAGRQRTYP